MIYFPLFGGRDVEKNEASKANDAFSEFYLIAFLGFLKPRMRLVEASGYIYNVCF